MHAVPVSAKNIASSSASSLKVAARYWFYLWPFGDVVLQEFVERSGFSDMPFEKSAVRFFADSREQRGDRRLDITDQRQIDGRAPPDMLRVLVDLNFLDVVAGQKFRERKVGAEHQQQVRLVDGPVCAAIAEQPGHPDRIGIVVLEPLLAAK